MCLTCWKDEGAPALIDNERVRAAAAAVMAIDELDVCGGALHIVVADWNVDDDSIEWSAKHIDAANRETDQEYFTETPRDLERACIEALRPLSVPERWSALILAESSEDFARLYVGAGELPADPDSAAERQAEPERAG